MDNLEHPTLRSVVVQAYSLTLELLDDLKEQTLNAQSTINGEYTVTCRNSDCSTVLDDDRTCLLINEYEGLVWFCPNCRDADLNYTITSSEPSVLTKKVLDDRLENFENAIEAKVSAFLEKMNDSTGWPKKREGMLAFFSPRILISFTLMF